MRHVIIPLLALVALVVVAVRSADARPPTEALDVAQAQVSHAPQSLSNWQNPAVTCGSAQQDGGCNAWNDGGPGADGGCAGSADGGFEADPIRAARGTHVTLNNPTATPIYLGGSTVQPGNAPIAICDEADAGTCIGTSITLPAASGGLHCTSISDGGVLIRTLVGSP